MTDVPLYTAEACRAIDAMAMQPLTDGGLGVSGQELMQRAAQFALDTLLSLPQYCGYQHPMWQGQQRW